MPLQRQNEQQHSYASISKFTVVTYILSPVLMCVEVNIYRIRYLYGNSVVKKTKLFYFTRYYSLYFCMIFNTNNILVRVLVVKHL